MNIEELEFEELNELAHETGDFDHIVKHEKRNRRFKRRVRRVFKTELYN